MANQGKKEPPNKTEKGTGANNAPPDVTVEKSKKEAEKSVPVDESDDDDDAPVEEVSNKQPKKKDKKREKQSDAQETKKQKKTKFNEDGEEGETIEEESEKDKQTDEGKKKKEKKQSKEGEQGKQDGKGKGKKKPKEKFMYSCFFGQLPFETTTSDKLKAHLKTVGVEDAQIRMLTGKDGKFRDEELALVNLSRLVPIFAGIAFADVPTEAERVRVLKLHHSEFEGRKINVEKVGCCFQAPPPHTPPYHQP
eukprot:151938-Prorocentrum_minimum.AAC.5